MPIENKVTPPRQTPWGDWKQINEVVTGVWRCTLSPSRNVFWLTPDARQKLPADAVSRLTHGEHSFIQEGWASPAVSDGLAAAVVVTTFAVGSGAFMFPESERTKAARLVTRVIGTPSEKGAK